VELQNIPVNVSIIYLQILKKFVNGRMQTKDELLKEITSEMYDNLCLMGYLKQGGTLVKNEVGGEKAVVTWAPTSIGKKEYDFKKRINEHIETDKVLFEFYEMY
jgi:hypothetical protein